MTPREPKIIGDRFHEDRYLPFARLGTYFEENNVTAMDALERAGLNYEYQLVDPVAHYKLPDSEYSMQVKGNYKAVVRAPFAGKFDNPQWIANVTDRYSLVQNAEIAEFIQPVTEQYPVKVAGELKGGRVVFYVLGGSTVEPKKNEKLTTYFLVKDGKDGHSGLSFGVFAVRVVCMNMQIFSRQTLYAYHIRHTESVRENAKIMALAMGNLMEIEQRILTSSERFMNTPISNNSAQDLFAAAYPLPKRSKVLAMTEGAAAFPEEYTDTISQHKQTHEVATERIRQMRLEANTCYGSFNLENPQTKETIWSALQSVTELSTWREGSNAESSILFGARANEVYRAYDFASQMVT